MDITPEEAQTALQDIQLARAIARNVFADFGYFLVLWGTIWTTGFLACQFLSQWVGLIFIVMIVSGMVGSSIIGIVLGGRVRAVPGSQMAFINSRLGIFNAVLYCFAALWVSIFLHSSSFQQIGILWITVVMFGTIITGAWLQQSALIGFGIGVTFISMIGYFVLPHYLWLWVALFSGLPLLGMGILMVKKK